MYILHIYVIFLVFSYYIHISGYSQHTQHTLFKNPPDEPFHPWSFKEASMKIHGNKKYIQGGQGEIVQWKWTLSLSESDRCNFSISFGSKNPIQADFFSGKALLEIRRKNIWKQFVCICVPKAPLFFLPLKVYWF